VCVCVCVCVCVRAHPVEVEDMRRGQAEPVEFEGMQRGGAWQEDVIALPQTAAQLLCARSGARHPCISPNHHAQQHCAAASLVEKIAT